MPIYGFDEESARRIAQSVRLSESARSEGRKSPGVSSSGASVGVRCMVGKIGTSSWSKSYAAAVMIYSGEPGQEQTSGTVAAYNYFANIPSAGSDRWVAVSNNGFGWILIAAEC